MFAIVDIETTGGFATSNGITEIAIILHNGREVEGYYSTLVNPRQLIPRYVTALTGINNDMVAGAPVFEEVAETVNNLLDGRIFVAHNVNFDYSFLKQQLENCGYPFQLKKLCTVRIARKLYSGLPSYSLGNLCRSLGIDLQNRHRAEGDARATATLFEKMLRDDEKGMIASMMKGRSAEQYLPPNLPLADIQALPFSPGVYYFENEKKEVIYIGKAVNLNNRVKSHFSNNDGGRRKQELLRQVHHIRYTVCCSELMALILESQEIRRLWPAFNRSQKKYHHKYGLYSYEDGRGYLRLVIEKKRPHLPAIYTFDWLPEGQAFIRKLTAAACGANEVQSHVEEQVIEEPAESYNKRINDAISDMKRQLPTFVLVEKDLFAGKDYAVYVVEKGRFYGMGYTCDPFGIPLTIEEWKKNIDPSADNDYIRGLLYQFAGKNSITRLNIQEAKP
ncbi:exonuclease domain-containing protein [Flavihumibacter solisilvae]|uniref:GIY-YIG domain-containing protein n=1 Tax=Flavihumibacter solisilvae TaxID=1349421 RepID=A0A0C1KYC9_9BACT|nr:exonuclease domain-containing protein [Flavihumibacter solisilvae]KIC92722.1 hypothetical protein OI18_21230 [Flavihumibacter solisilvae]